MSIAERIAQVRAEIARAARAAGRDPGEITLVGASKMTDAAACREAVAAGIDALGENRVQEMVKKLSEHAYDGVPLHFIGHLQRNKVNKVVGQAALIQSVGSLALLAEIEKTAAARELTQELLLEVNIGREENKSGVLPEQLSGLLEEISSLPALRVRGLMAIPPADASDVATQHYFSKMFEYFIDTKHKKLDNVSMDVLSMGMSADYVQAILAGANMVRVGSALFGARNYTNL